MKVIIDLIEAIREEIQNRGDFSFLAMLLKENDAGGMEFIGEKMISSLAIVNNQLVFYVEIKDGLLLIDPVLKILNELENEAMMMEVKISVSEQIFDVIGFGKSEESKHFVLFLESK